MAEQGPTQPSGGEQTGRTSVAGKWCVVTGASKGIGRAIAHVLAKEQACLMLTALHGENLEHVAQEVKQMGARDVDTIEGDLCSNEFVEQLAQKALSHGPVFVLVNNAGRYPSGLEETPLQGNPDEWEVNVRLNLLAPMRLTRRLAPSMAEAGNGHIINMASLEGVEPVANKCAYTATKWAMRGWSKACYGALRSKNVKVTTVNPGTVFTDMPKGDIPKGADPSHMMHDVDVAECVLAALRLSPNATIEEVTIKNVQPVYPQGIPT